AAPGRRGDGLAVHPGVRQHRGRDRHPPHHGRAVALRERRRVVPRGGHGRRRAAALRGPAGDRPQPAAAPAGARPMRRRGGRHVRRTFALIAGGGTAGHVQPAIAIARALVERGHRRTSIELVGSERGIESRLVPEAGFELTLLPGWGIQRRISWQNVKSVAALVVALVRAWRLVGRRRPRVVVSVGGYASVPCALAAVVRRVPIVVAEQNAAPGAANRLVGRFAKACAVSFPGTPLPRAVVTCNPVRPAVLAIDRARDAAAARTTLGIAPGRRVVLVFGGSLGALRINRAAVEAARLWAGRGDLHVRHI